MQRIKTHFSDTLINWFSKAKRDLPWRETKNPYSIWLSEIILQQTRVEQGLPYYQRFLEHHPDVHSLAQCTEKNVLKLWEGLGYYSRARNLHATAKYVSEELDGVFPDTYDGLIKLKGIGPYTAAAIASIAFGEATPVVDGNVFRFVSRYFGVEDDISKPATRKVFENLLKTFIPEDQPGDFNQATMEYGARVCAPSPKCSECVFVQGCFAYKNKSYRRLPFKSQKVKTEEVFMDYVIFEKEGNYLLQARNKGIWNGLYQFHLDEKKSPQLLIDKFGGEITRQSEKVKHLLTHRKLWVTFTHVRIDDQKDFRHIAKELSLEIFSKEEMLTLPRPKVIVNYLQEMVN
ncbi:MAG: A/G-specific adenine glycosylase [Cyclobacteriaceae bacterium]